jgi:hypothetical protein
MLALLCDTDSAPDRDSHLRRPVDINASRDILSRTKKVGRPSSLSQEEIKFASGWILSQHKTDNTLIVCLVFHQ